MDNNDKPAKTDRQELTDTIVTGVLAVVACAFLRAGIEKGYEKVVVARRQPKELA